MVKLISQSGIRIIKNQMKSSKTHVWLHEGAGCNGSKNTDGVGVGGGGEGGGAKGRR